MTAGVPDAPVRSPREKLERRVQLGALAFLLLVGVVVLRPFLVPVGWAGILAVVTWPLFRWVDRRLGGRTGLAATMMTVLMIFVVVGPAVVVSFALASEFEQVVADLRAWAAAPNATVPAWLRDLPWIGPQLVAALKRLADDPSVLQEWIIGQVGRAGGSLASVVGRLARGVANAGVAILTLFFLYRHGETLLPRIRRLARRLSGERVQAMFHPLGETVQAVMYGMLLTAFAQGGLAMLGYWAAGLRAPALLGAATILLALIPFGAPLMYVPLSLWLMARGRLLAGVGLLAWGTLVVSTVDNVIRTWFISGATRLPFLLVFLGVLGGLAAFGTIGLFIGPVSIALLLELWHEWSQEPTDLA